MDLYIRCRLGRTYAPVSHAKFVRDVAVTNDYLPSSAKKARLEHYYEERMHPLKQYHQVAEPRAVYPVHPIKVIEIKPVLHEKCFDEWEDPPPPKPKRVRTRRQPKLQQDSTTTTTSTKPVEKVDNQESEKVAPASKATDAEIEKGDNKPIAEPNEDGVYELDDLMASTLQDELNQIMVKVRQDIPDDPPTEAEELVANKFRNEAGDDLQKAMGLSVTARLLNVHNPLYAKLQFSGKPEAGCLQAFINQYKITAFKRIADSTRDIFAARFDHIADFDKLCVHNEVKCGSATVTIIPCYKYFSKPSTLKTIYADRNTKYRSQKTEKSVKNAAVKIDNATAVVKMSVVNTEKESVAKTSNTTPTKTTTTANSKMPEKVAVKAPAQEQSKQTAPEKPKPAVKETPKDAPVVTTKVTPKKVENKDNKNDIGTNKIDDMMMVVDEEIGEEGDEEMTDQDILALMSGGIVLDECSGSDDEK